MEEKNRVRQMNLMFSEDYERFWDRQSKIWDEEKKARERLMNDVMQGWKQQINQNIMGKYLLLHAIIDKDLI